jgi:phospholipase/lecithinase/hemolysin
MAGLVKQNNALLHCYLSHFSAAHPDARIQIFPTYKMFDAIISHPSRYLAPDATASRLCIDQPGWDGWVLDECRSFVFADALHTSMAVSKLVAADVGRVLRGQKPSYA